MKIISNKEREGLNEAISGIKKDIKERNMKQIGGYILSFLYGFIVIMMIMGTITLAERNLQICEIIDINGNPVDNIVSVPNGGTYGQFLKIKSEFKTANRYDTDLKMVCKWELNRLWDWIKSQEMKK